MGDQAFVNLKKNILDNEENFCKQPFYQCTITKTLTIDKTKISSPSPSIKRFKSWRWYSKRNPNPKNYVITKHFYIGWTDHRHLRRWNCPFPQEWIIQTQLREKKYIKPPKWPKITVRKNSKYSIRIRYNTRAFHQR